MSATPHRRLQDLSVKASRCEGSFPRQTNFADGQRSFICAECIFEPYAKYNISVVSLCSSNGSAHSHSSCDVVGMRPRRAFSILSESNLGCAAGREQRSLKAKFLSDFPLRIFAASFSALLMRREF
jgi:hypothetical protein